MTKALLLDKSYELLDGYIPDIDGAEVVDLELGGYRGLWIHRGEIGYITFEDRSPFGVHVLRYAFVFLKNYTGKPNYTVVCEVRAKPFAIEIRTPQGWNVIARTSTITPLIENVFYADICAKSDRLFVVKNHDGTCGMMRVPKDVDGSYCGKAYNVLRGGTDGSLFDLLKGNGEIYDIYRAYDIAKSPQSRLIGFGSSNSKTLIDCTGRIIAEGVSDIRKMDLDIFRVWRIGDGGKEFNILLYDDGDTVYKVVFDRWGKKVSLGCPVSREMALNKTVEHDDDNNVFTIFYDDGFSIALMDNLLGVSMFAEGAVFNDVAEIALSNGRKLYVYVTADGRKSVVVSPNVFHQLKSIDNDNENKAMMFDRVEADYENNLVRGHIGEKAYLFDFNAWNSDYYLPESDIFYIAEGYLHSPLDSMTVYVCRTEDGRFAVVDRRSWDTRYFYDIKFAMDESGQKVCMYGYRDKEGRKRDKIMIFK